MSKGGGLEVKEVSAIVRAQALRKLREAPRATVGVMRLGESSVRPIPIPGTCTLINTQTLVEWVER